MKQTPVKILSVMVVFCVAGYGADSSADKGDELAQLRAVIGQQQAQIQQLRRDVDEESRLLDRLLAKPEGKPPSLGEVVSLVPFVPLAASPVVPPPEFQARPQTPASDPIAAKVDALSKTVEGVSNTLRGFRFSGDFRYRLDLQLRSGNSVAPPLQNTRGRYRARVNIDKDLAPGLTTHLQLSTGPYNNEITNDQDFGGVATKHPFSVAEAWVKYTKGRFSVRGGRVEEVFADNSRFLWDDDLRFNGFEGRYEIPISKRTTFELRAADYILTNPNTPIVPAGSPFLAAGYKVGEKLRDATLFHPGFVLRTKAEKWTLQAYGSFSWYRNTNQISLVSTANGVGPLAGSALGLTLSGAITGTGDALTTPGGALFAARHFQIAHLGYRADYADFKIGKTSLPLWADFQTAVNTGTGSDRNAFMATVNLGSVRKAGDLRYLYQFSFKQANSMISQFTDDDLGTGTGVNTQVHALRLDWGFTRFLQWQNLLFIQDPITGNRPGFFVNVPKGANTTFRYLGQLAFTF